MRVFIVVKGKRECAKEKLPPDATRNCNEKSIAEIGLNPSHCDKLDSTEPPILALEIVLRSPAPGLLRKLRLKLKHIWLCFAKKANSLHYAPRKQVLVPSAAIAILQASSQVCIDDADCWSRIDQFSPMAFSTEPQQHQCERFSGFVPPLQQEVCVSVVLLFHLPMLFGGLLCLRHAANSAQDS